MTRPQLAGFDLSTEAASERNYSPVSITKRERFTLLAVRSVFDVLKGTPFHDDVHSVMSKLEHE